MIGLLEIEKHPLTAVLKEHGIPKANVAAYTGINPPRVYQLLNGKARPSAREKTLLDALMYRLAGKASK